MREAVGVVFSPGGKVYSFDPGSLQLAWNEKVICQTSRGKEYGRVVEPNHPVDDPALAGRLKRVVRRATEADDEQVRQNRREAKAGDARVSRRHPRARPRGEADRRRGRLRRLAPGLLVRGRGQDRDAGAPGGAVAAAAPARRAARRRSARAGAPVRRLRALRDAALLHPLPLPRAADRAADGEGSGSADVVGPDHRPLRAAALLPCLRASDVPELPRPRAARRRAASRPRRAPASSRPTRC